MTDVVIVGAKRTAIGSMLGQFTGVPTPTLGAAAIGGALDHARLGADQVDEVIMGCVLPAGLGQAPARQASRAAGIPDAAGATTINKVCGSGMKAIMLATDEQPGKSDVAKIPTLRPAFRKDGTVTAASSSSISDGAAATVLTSADEAARLGLKPLARIVGHTTWSQEPEWFTTAPVQAIANVLGKAGWSVADVDLFEVNEAFACVAMAPMKDLGIPHDRLNVNGGACALGHPIGASGARLVVTLLHALKARGGRRGVASLCIGGGEATAIAVELA